MQGHRCLKSLIFRERKLLNAILRVNLKYMKMFLSHEIDSGYVCNRGSPSGERDTASPRGRYGERPQRDSCLKIHM